MLHSAMASLLVVPALRKIRTSLAITILGPTFSTGFSKLVLDKCAQNWIGRPCKYMPSLDIMRVKNVLSSRRTHYLHRSGDRLSALQSVKEHSKQEPTEHKSRFPITRSWSKELLQAFIVRGAPNHLPQLSLNMKTWWIPVADSSNRAHQRVDSHSTMQTSAWYHEVCMFRLGAHSIPDLCITDSGPAVTLRCRLCRK